MNQPLHTVVKCARCQKRIDPFVKHDCPAVHKVTLTMKQCVYPTIRFVAYEQRIGKQIFVPDPSLRGRYILTDRAVAIVACPQCKSIPGEPCKGRNGYWAGTHADRRTKVKWRERNAVASDVIENKEFDWEAYQ